MEATDAATLMRDSLVRRMRTMTGLYEEAVDTMTLDHVNHVDAEGRLPIAFCLFHYVNMHDTGFCLATGASLIYDDEWEARIQPVISSHGMHEPAAEMWRQKIGDYDAFKEYQRAVFARTMAHLESMDPDDFLRVVIPPPYPAEVATTYSARVADPEIGITVLDAFECWLYQHGLRHMGEIELARGFQGLSGMTA